METQHVLIPDGIDDGIGMQGFRGLAILVQFSTKQLGGGGVSATCTGIHGKDGCTSESEHHILLHPLGNQFVHVAKLRAVALIEYQHNVLLRHHLAQFLVTVPCGWFHQVREFLDGGDDDVHVVILNLFQQDTRRGVAIGTVGLEVIILLHGLIVQVLTIHHEEHLLDVLHPRCQLGCLK